MINIDTIIAASVADEQQDLANKAGETVFGELRDVAKGFDSSETFNMSLEGIEIEYMEMFHKDEKFKDGKWKFSKLPVKWRTAKSVIGSAIDHKVNFTGKGKSAIESEVKAIKAMNRTPSVAEFLKGLDKLTKYFDSIDMAERVNMDSKTHSFFMDRI